MENTEKQIMEIQTRIDKMEKELHAIRTTGEKTNRSIEQVTELLKGPSLNPHDKGMLGDIIELQKENDEKEKRLLKLEKEAEKNSGINKWAIWALVAIISSLLTKLLTQVLG